jgi:hypothetical protein
MITNKEVGILKDLLYLYNYYTLDLKHIGIMGKLIKKASIKQFRSITQDEYVIGLSHRKLTKDFIKEVWEFKRQKKEHSYIRWNVKTNWID